ncbi:hypothetical protein BGX30_004632, partial [Mortierella sp. GBA39]
MKIISIAAAVLAIAIAAVQAVPVPDGGLANTVIKNNHVGVEAPIDVDAHNAKVLKRHTVNTEVKDNKVDVKAPIKVDAHNLKVLSSK